MHSSLALAELARFDRPQSRRYCHPKRWSSNSRGVAARTSELRTTICPSQASRWEAGQVSSRRTKPQAQSSLKLAIGNNSQALVRTHWCMISLGTSSRNLATFTQTCRSNQESRWLASWSETLISPKRRHRARTITPSTNWSSCRASAAVVPHWCKRKCFFYLIFDCDSITDLTVDLTIGKLSGSQC